MEAGLVVAAAGLGAARRAETISEAVIAVATGAVPTRAICPVRRTDGEATELGSWNGESLSSVAWTPDRQRVVAFDRQTRRAYMAGRAPVTLRPGRFLGFGPGATAFVRDGEDRAVQVDLPSGRLHLDGRCAET